MHEDGLILRDQEIHLSQEHERTFPSCIFYLTNTLPPFPQSTPFYFLPVSFSYSCT